MQFSLSTYFVVGLLAFGFAMPAGAKDRKNKRSRKELKQTEEKVERPEKSPLIVDEAKKVKKGRFGLLGGLSYEKLTFTRKSEAEEISVELSGFGLLAGAEYVQAFGPKFKATGGGGLHYISVSGASDILTLNVSETSLLVQGTGIYYFASKLGAGGFFSLDYGLTGSQSASTEEETASRAIEAWQLISFGPRVLFDTTTKITLTSELGLGTGSFTVAEAEESTKFSSTVLRFGVIFWL